MPPWPLLLLRGIGVLRAPSAAISFIRRLRIAAHRMGVVVSVLGKGKAAGLARVLGASARETISRSGSMGAGTPAVR